MVDRDVNADDFLARWLVGSELVNKKPKTGFLDSYIYSRIVTTAEVPDLELGFLWIMAYHGWVDCHLGLKCLIN
jgi:hypothetical protein